MKANRKNNTSKALIIINIIAIVALVWLAVSTIDVIAHNLDTNPTYALWNIYNLIG